MLHSQPTNTHVYVCLYAWLRFFIHNAAVHFPAWCHGKLPLAASDVLPWNCPRWWPNCSTCYFECKQLWHICSCVARAMYAISVKRTFLEFLPAKEGKEGRPRCHSCGPRLGCAPDVAEAGKRLSDGVKPILLVVRQVIDDPSSQSSNGERTPGTPGESDTSTCDMQGSGGGQFPTNTMQNDKGSLAAHTERARVASQEKTRRAARSTSSCSTRRCRSTSCSALSTGGLEILLALNRKESTLHERREPGDGDAPAQQAR